ncbi:DNA helicase, partial [Tanacetum coccineum]
RVRSISDTTPFQDATGRQKYRRKVDIESLDGNIVELTMWDDLATQFNKQEIQKLPPPIIIAVSSCRVFKEKYSFNLPLQVTNYRYDDPEQEKTNRQTLYALLQQNPTTFKEPPTYRYNFKATVADGTATAEFTFFTAVGQKITGHPCSHLKQKYETTDTSQLPVEMVNTIGEKHIFQIEFAPST